MSRAPRKAPQATAEPKPEVVIAAAEPQPPSAAVIELESDIVKFIRSRQSIRDYISRAQANLLTAQADYQQAAGMLTTAEEEISYLQRQIAVMSGRNPVPQNYTLATTLGPTPPAPSNWTPQTGGVSSIPANAQPSAAQGVGVSSIPTSNHSRHSSAGDLRSEVSRLV